MKQFQNFEEENIHYWTGRTDVAAMEAIARQTPLSEKQRPEWDLTVLRVAGMEAKADPEIWKAVWTKEERINNASTPMFLVEGVKKDAELCDEKASSADTDSLCDYLFVFWNDAAGRKRCGTSEDGKYRHGYVTGCDRTGTKGAWTGQAVSGAVRCMAEKSAARGHGRKLYLRRRYF